MKRKKGITLKKLRILTLFLACILAVLFGIISIAGSGYTTPKKKLIIPSNNSISRSAPEVKKPKLALIIDDFGQSRAGVREMMQINRPLTIAVMPFLSYSKKDAEEAHKNGYEVIVHLPMQSQKIDIKSWLGPDPVEVSQNDNEIDKVVIDSLNNIPYAVGVNIHMGALASGDERVISCVMKMLKQKSRYFIDSRTSSNTICDKISKEVGIPYGKRNVFLDNGTKDKEYIKKQLLFAADIAEKYDFAIAIGHVGSMGGTETAESIKEMLPQIEERGIELVFVSQVVKVFK
ncbi:MAG: divergent polysaccharide deacetylase family protein [Bacteroidota bacterium]|nr:divergent polysaccharide deacetylase family protein [Bacteroidota bacterium]